MPNELFWLGGLCPSRGPAASETLAGKVSPKSRQFAINEKVPVLLKSVWISGRDRHRRASLQFDVACIAVLPDWS